MFESKKKKVAVVAGTRPEVIKMAPVYLELKKSDKLTPVFISTAQHRQMLDQALDIFGIKPDYDMNVMREGQTLNDLTVRILEAWKQYFSQNTLDAVLVQGDTTTVLASSIAAFYERVPIGHIEAGLRTGNLMSPWPEEMNRRLSDPISQWCFPPTELSKKNLVSEKIPEDRCFITGNTVVDALLWMKNKLKQENVSSLEICASCGISDFFAKNFIEKNDAKWILVTGHRRESFGKGFADICEAIASIESKYPNVGILYPVHLNPNVQEPVNRFLAYRERVCLISPVAYREFIWLMDRCHFVLSDSGGVQEEAPSLGKPVLVMRDTTERPEGVEAGTCTLVGTSPEKILKEVSVLLEDANEYRRRSALKNPYGDGTASKKIRKVLEESL